MSDFGTIARPYAEAIFSLAKESNSYDKWSDALQFINVLSNNDEIINVLQNPSISHADKSGVVVALVEKAKGDAEVVRFVETLIENERFGAAQAIANRYEILRKEVDNELDVVVETALDLDADAIASLSKSLEKRFAKKVNIETVLKPELIGGIIIHAGDTVIDDSIKSKLGKLSSALRK